MYFSKKMESYSNIKKIAIARHDNVYDFFTDKHNAKKIYIMNIAVVWEERGEWSTSHIYQKMGESKV